MKRTVLLLFAATLWAVAETPRFADPEPVLDGGVQIDVDYYGAPVMYDWDLDGSKDMICGQFTGGYIRLYRNIGPDSAPEFSGYEYFYADGSQITLPSG